MKMRSWFTFEINLVHNKRDYVKSKKTYFTHCVNIQKWLIEQKEGRKEREAHPC